MSRSPRSKRISPARKRNRMPPAPMLRSPEAVRRCQTSDLCGPRLEYLHWVTRWILGQDLMPGGPLDNLAAELHALGPELFDRRTDIGDRDLEPVPAARSRRAAGDSCASGTRLVQEQPQIAARQAGESG